MTRYCENDDCKRKITVTRRIRPKGRSGSNHGKIIRFSDNRHTLCDRCHKRLFSRALQEQNALSDT